MIATRTELIDWTSPEVLGAWSTLGPNRCFARCPFPSGSAKAQRWWIAREKSLGIQRDRHKSNHGEGVEKKPYFYQTDDAA